MSMHQLGDLIKGLQTEYGENLERADTGPAGGFDGPPLPETIEYRLEVVKGEYKASKQGNQMVVLTLEVLEPEEWAGRKVQENLMAGGESWAREKFAKTVSALGVSLSGISGDDWDGFAQLFVGQTAVGTMKTWGEQEDRSGVRWLNKDVGQSLRTNISPPKKKSNTGNSLRPDIVINKTEPFPAEPGVVNADGTPEAAPTLPSSGVGVGAAAYTGPRLPPGLGG